MRQIVLLVFMIIFFWSCKPHEKIEPSFEAKPLSSKKIQLSFKIGDVDVERKEPEGEIPIISDIPLLGGIFKHIGKIFVDMKIQDGIKIQLEPLSVDLDELEQVDFMYIEQIMLDNAYINLKKKGVHSNRLDNENQPNLNFIKHIEICLELPEQKSIDNKDQNIITILSYEKPESDLNTKVINFKIEREKWKSILRDNRTFIIHTTLTVKGRPKEDLKIGGKINLSIDVNLDLLNHPQK